MTQALIDRLAPYLHEEPATRVMAGSAHWLAGSFGNVMNDVRSLVVHMTAGWPSRNRAEGFVDRYIVPGTDKRGLGTQYYLAGDGTMIRLIDLPRRTGHASYVNTWALGIEIGNLGTTAPPPGSRWRALNLDDDLEDFPGIKAWLKDQRSDNPREVILGWWTTDNFAGPWREPVGAPRMLFGEPQYRTLALTCRYVAEHFGIPRNVPLLPHALRGALVGDGDGFRRIMLAEPGFAALLAAMTADGAALTAADFTPANAATFDTAYDREIQALTADLRRRNRAWTTLCEQYRGFHGHGFSGATDRDFDDKQACPGALFDWHRFAREISDHWWLPFDVDDAGSTNVARRPYRNWDGDTPTLEYYFDENEDTRTARIVEGVHGLVGSPETFDLDAGSPVYAMANGELVAARIPPPAPGMASTAFVLMRHEVFHLPHPLAQGIAMPPPIPDVAPPMPGAIDYSLEPTYVYLLYMHLGRAAGIDLDAPSEHNPDWLNRVLVREKECDLGVAYYGHATHHDIPTDAAWDQPMPGGVRGTLQESWAIDQLALDVFLDALRAGNVALAPPRDPLYQGIRILLGDYLGRAGVRSVQNGVGTHGVRIEAFSSALLPGFTPVFASDWTVPAGTVVPHAVAYQSEWARAPTVSERAILLANGFDPTLPLWWSDVALTTAWNDAWLPPAAQLPASGYVWHYSALDVARWVNDVTWKNERRKYDDPAALAMNRPPSRRG